MARPAGLIPRGGGRHRAAHGGGVGGGARGTAASGMRGLAASFGGVQGVVATARDLGGVDAEASAGTLAPARLRGHGGLVRRSGASGWLLEAAPLPRRSSVAAQLVAVWPSCPDAGPIWVCGRRLCAAVRGGDSGGTAGRHPGWR